MCAYIEDYGGCEVVHDADKVYSDLFQLHHGTLFLQLALDQCLPPTTCMTVLEIEIDTCQVHTDG